jgi:hypothetical protein
MRVCNVQEIGDTMNTEDIMTSLKMQMEIHIAHLLEQGVRKQNIEIELMHYLKRLVYAEKH